MESIKLSFATVGDVSALEPIFNLYREFYGMQKDTQRATEFLTTRLQNKESVVLFAEKQGNIIGFVQLFPTFSSTTLQKVYILNDLYVIDSERNQGVAKMLINRVIDLGRSENCVRISLSTAKDNPAQSLYESIGFKESSFKFYNYAL